MFSNNNRGSGGALSTVLRVLLLLIVIAAGSFIGIMGWFQISNLNIINQAQTQRIDNLYDELLLPSDVDSAIRAESGSIGDQLEALQTEIDSLARENNDLQAAIDAQGDTLDSVDGARVDLASTVESIQESLDALIGASQALQNDITSNGTAVDDLGAEYDNVNNQLIILRNKLDEVEGDLEEAEAIITQTREALDERDRNEVNVDENGETVVVEGGLSSTQFARFYLWSLVTRAKIHLLEDDIDAASSVLTNAVAQAEALAADASGDDAETITSIVEALQGAQDSLSDKPAASNIALDSVLDTLEPLIAP